MGGVRNTSSGCNVPSRSKCQNVQPLQLGAFCNSAPTLWIEPRISPRSVIRPARPLH